MKNTEIKYVRVDVRVRKSDVPTLDHIAKDQGRSRRNMCETKIAEMIADFKRRRKHK